MEPKSRGGRPRETVDPVRVSVRLSGTDYDRLDRMASEAGVSVPALIRAAAVSVSKTRPPSQPVHTQD